MTGLSLRALISASRFGKLAHRQVRRIGDVAERTRKFVRPAHVHQRDAWALLEQARKLIRLDPFGLLLAAQAPHKPWQERDCGQQREGGQAVSERGRVAGSGLAAGMAEPGVGHRARHHADKRCKDIMLEGNAREAKRVVGKIEREEGHEPDKGNEAPALRLDLGDQAIEPAT